MKKIIFVFFMCFILLGCDSGSDDNADVDWEIKYEVIAEDTYNWNTIYEIEYLDNTNNIVTVNDSPDSPWTIDFITDQADFSINILGVAMMCDGTCTDFSSTVTVKVYIDDVLYKTETAQMKLKS